MFTRTTLACVLGFWSVIGASAQSVREVTVTERTVVPVKTQVRFTTLLVLPEDEEILDFVCGDKDFWVVSGAQHLAYVKPAKEKAATNLNLVTASGRVYSFLLTESTDAPDLKVYVGREDGGNSSDAKAQKRFFRAEEIAALRAELDALTEREADRLSATRREIDETLARARAQFPTTLHFPYRWKRDAAPFFVEAIFHDGTSTYLRARATELPALYELRDGQPNLITFDVRDGLYVVPKVLVEGYLAIGKKRLPFVARPEGRP